MWQVLVFGATPAAELYTGAQFRKLNTLDAAGTVCITANQ
jgi:hypothetical protein